MIPSQLHAKLIESCLNENVDDVKHWLDSGAEPNFNIRTPLNALAEAIKKNNYKIINLLLEHGAIVKEFVLQKAIEKDKNYFHLLIPDFTTCKDETLLMGTLQAAINIDDLDLAKQAINQGAKPQSLFIYAGREFSSTGILQLLVENGFDIHAEKNMLLTEWLGSSLIGEAGHGKPAKHDLLAFISDYYLEEPKSIEKFKSWRLADKSRLFREGLAHNNFNMMKFAFLIGADKNASLSSVLHRYYATNQGNISNTHSTIFQNDKSKKIDHEIIQYILNSDIKFNKTTISNAVCFEYTNVLNALSHIHDLEYAYQMAYKYQKDELINYFIDRGVSKEAQSFAKMKVSAIKGNIKELHKAINDGANLEALDTDIIVEVINENQLKSLKCFYDSGVLLDTSLNKYLDMAMRHHKAYETISYLIELGLDITNVKNIPQEYKRKYPALADMWQKRFRDIFDYTVHLVKEVYPKVEDKRKEEILKKIAEFSTLPYVIKRSEEKSLEY